jgi:hypothetical protein
MRVLQINSIFQGGGVDSQTLDLCRGLDAVGVESHLLVPANTRLMPAARAALGDRVHTLAGGKAAWTWGRRGWRGSWAPICCTPTTGAIIGSPALRRASPGEGMRRC